MCQTKYSYFSSIDRYNFSKMKSAPLRQILRSTPIHSKFSHHKSFPIGGGFCSWFWGEIMFVKQEIVKTLGLNLGFLSVDVENEILNLQRNEEFLNNKYTNACGKLESKYSQERKKWHWIVEECEIVVYWRGDNRQSQGLRRWVREGTKFFLDVVRWFFSDKDVGFVRIAGAYGNQNFLLGPKG